MLARLRGPGWNCRTITLHVLPNNEPALALYRVLYSNSACALDVNPALTQHPVLGAGQRLGFRIVRREHNYYSFDGTTHDAYLMQQDKTTPPAMTTAKPTTAAATTTARIGHDNA